MSSSVVTSLATEVLCWSRGAPPLIEVAGEGVYIHTYCGVVRSRCCCCTRRRSCLIDPIPSLPPSFPLSCRPALPQASLSSSLPACSLAASPPSSLSGPLKNLRISPKLEIKTPDLDRSGMERCFYKTDSWRGPSSLLNQQRCRRRRPRRSPPQGKSVS